MASRKKKLGVDGELPAHHPDRSLRDPHDGSERARPFGVYALAMWTYYPVSHARKVLCLCSLMTLLKYLEDAWTTWWNERRYAAMFPEGNVLPSMTGLTRAAPPESSEDRHMPEVSAHVSPHVRESCDRTRWGGGERRAEGVGQGMASKDHTVVIGGKAHFRLRWDAEVSPRMVSISYDEGATWEGVWSIGANVNVVIAVCRQLGYTEEEIRTVRRE